MAHVHLYELNITAMRFSYSTCFFISITFISIPSLIFVKKLSIYAKHNASNNLRHQLNFFFELINLLELYAFVDKTKAIFSLLTKFINQKKSLKRDSPFAATLELNFFHTVIWHLEKLSIS